MPPSRRRHLLAALALALLGAPAILRAEAGLPKKEITEKTSASFADLRLLTEAKNYPGAIALIDRLLAQAPAGSYDVYVLSQVKAQVLMAQDKLADAIAPIEAALALAEGNPAFLDPAARLEQLHILAQLHYQKAADQKTPEEQRIGYRRALDLLDRWFTLSPKPGVQARLFAASLHYNLAVAGSGEPDPAALRAALGQCELGLRLVARPPVQLRQLLVACHMQLGENARAAEQLEILAAREPKNATTWSQLLALYLTMAGDEAAEPAQARAANLRALLTIERAQAAGFLASPKDNYTRVAILFNLGRFVRAAELLERGLADGGIESAWRNWELLASAYQQSGQEAGALDAYARAVERFPDRGDLEFSLAQALYAAGDTGAAYARASSAVGKAGLPKPGQTRLYLAFLAYELRRIDEARTWLDQARATGEVPAASLDPLDRAIAEAAKIREALKNS